tara:strand:- start:125 stop:613 length:489 start_codon:yes stop_codon:yes gene_type:complete
MNAITVSPDGSLEIKCVSKKTKYIVHDSFDDIELRSKWTVEECCKNVDILHCFNFPPPINRYLIPKDAYFIRVNGDIKPSDIENICQKVDKKSIHVSIYEKQNKNQEEDNDDDDFEDDEEEDDEDDDEDNDDDDDDEGNDDDDDEIGWNEEDENIDDIAHKK